MFDRIGEMAEIDTEALDMLLMDIQDPDLERLLGELTAPDSGLLPEADPDAIPDQVDTRCQPSDLWVLGEHRLIVADCTDPASVVRLMDGTRAKLLVTDPPYAVDYVEKARDMNRRGYVHSRGTLAAAMEGDGIAAGQEDDLWRGAFCISQAEAAEEAAAVYVWHGYKTTGLLVPLLLSLGYLHHQTLLWVKNNFVIGRTDYQAGARRSASTDGSKAIGHLSMVRRTRPPSGR